MSSLASGRPAKPHPEFPLYAHSCGQWAKKIRGRVRYFGTWDDPNGALERFESEKSDLFSGRSSKRANSAVTVADICNSFTSDIQEKVESGKRSPHTFRDYFATCKRVVETFGRSREVASLTPEDFRILHRVLSKDRGFHALQSEIINVRTLFNSAVEEGLIERTPVYGKRFSLPSRADYERAKLNTDDADRVFSAAEIRQVINSAGVPLKAMILLGINAGFGNTDVASLPNRAIDLETGYVRFPRPKTARPRKAWLWPETVDALNEVRKRQVVSLRKEDRELVFLTKRRQRWIRFDLDTKQNPPKFSVKDSLAQEFKKLLKKHGIERRRLSFYGLRHTFATVASDSRDQLAVDFVMGHLSREDVIPSKYRHGISDDRIRDVCQFVRNWLFEVK